MSTRKQVRANRANSKFSTGPSKKSLDHTRFNGLTHGLRSGTLILPNENPQRFRQLHDDWIESVRPRDPAEHQLVFRIVRDQHMIERVERAIDEAITTQGEEADDRQDEDVGKLKRWLFWDSRGPHPMHGLSGMATGGPSTSWSGNVDDPLEPSVVVRRLESSAKGCEALIEPKGRPPVRCRAIVTGDRAGARGLRTCVPSELCTDVHGHMCHARRSWGLPRGHYLVSL
jgi:hypothetical protein